MVFGIVHYMKPEKKKVMEVLINKCKFLTKHDSTKKIKILNIFFFLIQNYFLAWLS